jgi:hypothetical protein
MVRHYILQTEEPSNVYAVPATMKGPKKLRPCLACMGMNEDRNQQGTAHALLSTLSWCHRAPQGPLLPARRGLLVALSSSFLCQAGGDALPALLRLHSVPCLIHRTFACGVSVLRCVCEGNVRMWSCGCSVRMAPHAGHSTALMAVRGRRSAARSITPIKAHRVGGPDDGRVPTGSRRGACCPARFLVVCGGGAMGEGTVEEAASTGVGYAEEAGAGGASTPLAGRRSRGVRSTGLNLRVSPNEIFQLLALTMMLAPTFDEAQEFGMFC